MQGTDQVRDVERLIAANGAAPGRVGQGTAVEQSRAIEEVRGMLFLARQFPRSEAEAVARVRALCEHRSVAARAFFSYPKAGKTVSGKSIHLAKELARVWGNVRYGLGELRRDDQYRQSELTAWAWDLETNTRVETTFIVPHGMDTKTGIKAIEDLRSIYENNANAGARRLREQIFSVLPTWLVDMAADLCSETLSRGDGKTPLPVRIEQMVSRFEQLGVTADQLEQERGRPRDKWTPLDLGHLETLGGSLYRGEVHRDEVFPPVRVTADEVVARTQAQQQAPAAVVDESLMAPLNPSPVWPVPAQPGTGRRSVRQSETVEVGSPDDFPPEDQ
jgi:hypothetical protein